MLKTDVSIYCDTC